MLILMYWPQCYWIHFTSSMWLKARSFWHSEVNGLFSFHPSEFTFLQFRPRRVRPSRHLATRKSNCARRQGTPSFSVSRGFNRANSSRRRRKRYEEACVVYGPWVDWNTYKLKWLRDYPCCTRSFGNIRCSTRNKRTWVRKCPTRSKLGEGGSKVSNPMNWV